MQGIVKVCSKIVGTPLNDLQDLYKVLEEGESHSGWPQSSLVGWIYAAAIRAQSVTNHDAEQTGKKTGNLSQLLSPLLYPVNSILNYVFLWLCLLLVCD